MLTLRRSEFLKVGGMSSAAFDQLHVALASIRPPDLLVSTNNDVSFRRRSISDYRLA